MERPRQTLAWYTLLPSFLHVREYNSQRFSRGVGHTLPLHIFIHRFMSGWGREWRRCFFRKWNYKKWWNMGLEFELALEWSYNAMFHICDQSLPSLPAAPLAEMRWPLSRSKIFQCTKFGGGIFEEKRFGGFQKKEKIAVWSIFRTHFSTPFFRRLFSPPS